MDEITPRDVYFNRRTFIRGGLVAASAATTAVLYRKFNGVDVDTTRQPPIDHLVRAPHDGPYWGDEPITPRLSILNYNNFYEFTTDKDGVASGRGQLQDRRLEGRGRRAGATSRECSTSTSCSKLAPLEERVYRMRCVEAWSMVIPWAGFPLAQLLDRGRADGRRQVRRVRDAARSRAHAGPEDATCSTGRTSKGCAWTRRCTR